MRKSRVRSDKLSEGMVVAADAISIVGNTIVPKGTILDVYTIDKIQKSGITAVIIEIEEDGKTVKRQNFTSIEEIRKSDEFKKFKENFEISKEETKRSLDKIIRTDAEVDIDNLIAEVDVVISSSSTGMEIFKMLNCMKDEIDDVYQHSLNVALTSAIIAKWNRLPKNDIDEIISAALLHDIGKLKVPYEILNKSSLSNEEKRFLRKHAIYGYNILKNKVDEQIAQVALTHHERYDGSGYPMSQKGPEIPKISRIVAIADIFDELTGKKANNRIASCPFEAIRLFERDGFQKFDTEYLLTFLSGIADTYVGYDAKLSNGKRGTIVFANKTRPSRPMIKTENRYIDLAKEPELQIVELL